MAIGGRSVGSPVMAEPTSNDTLGPNAWLVDEMYEQYLADPTSVSESWRDFSADYQRDSDVTSSGPKKSLPATGGVNETGQVPAVVTGANGDGQPTAAAPAPPATTTAAP